MTPNPGHCPPEATGKRVRVRLAHEAPGAAPKDRNWPADGKHGVCWAKRGHPFDIAEYEVLK